MDREIRELEHQYLLNHDPEVYHQYFLACQRAGMPLAICECGAPAAELWLGPARLKCDNCGAGLCQACWAKCDLCRKNYCLRENADCMGREVCSVCESVVCNNCGWEACEICSEVFCTREGEGCLGGGEGCFAEHQCVEEEEEGRRNPIDEEIKELERLASLGDEEARARLILVRERAGLISPRKWYSRPRYWVGNIYSKFKAPIVKKEVFLSAVEPTQDTHGSQYWSVIGPFETKRGADYMVSHGNNNPSCETVEAAERLALKEENARRIRLYPEEDMPPGRNPKKSKLSKPSLKYQKARAARILGEEALEARKTQSQELLAQKFYSPARLAEINKIPFNEDGWKYALGIVDQQKLDLKAVIRYLSDLILDGQIWEQAAETLSYLPSYLKAQPGEWIEDPLQRWPGYPIQVPTYLYRGGPGASPLVYGALPFVVALTFEEARGFGGPDAVQKFRFKGGRVAIDWRSIVSWQDSYEYSANFNGCLGIGADLVLPAPDMEPRMGMALFNYPQHAVVCNPESLEEVS